MQTRSRKSKGKNEDKSSPGKSTLTRSTSGKNSDAKISHNKENLTKIESAGKFGTQVSPIS